MYRAYDMLLQTAVSADIAAKNYNNEAYRYECLCCGEEVFLAAQDSKYMSTHFRHLSGNNDKTCELYLGQQNSSISISRKEKNKQDRIEFYYDNLHKYFFVGMKFDETEIAYYEKNDISVEISAGRHMKPFFTKKITTQNFSENIPEFYILETYADSYFISNTLNNKKREYAVFSSNYPTFFKIMGNDENFTAKLIQSKSLYTGVRYFVAWPGQNTAQIRFGKFQPDDVEIINCNSFKTFRDNNVWGMELVFKKKGIVIEQLLEKWGYTLHVSEDVTLLWPPAIRKNDSLSITKHDAYFYTTFRFEEYGNTNAESRNITMLKNNIVKVNVDDNIKIIKNNVDLLVEFCKYDYFGENILEENYKKRIYNIPKNGDFYLFSDFGVRKLFPGEKIYLTPHSYITEYISNYSQKNISFLPLEKLCAEDMRMDKTINFWDLDSTE